MNKPPPANNVPPGDTGDTGDFDDDDAAWFNRLAGHITTAQDPGTLSEADALRRVIKRSAETQVQSDPELQAALTQAQTEAHLQALLTQLREQEALPAPAWWRRWSVAAAGAAMVAAVVGVLLIPRLMTDPVYYDEPPTMRGAVPTQTRHVAAPKFEAEALVQRLKTPGLTAAIYQTGHVFVVDVFVDPDALPDAAPKLSAEGLPAQPGPTRVEFLPR